MITFTCDVCGGSAIPRTNRTHRAFFAEDSPTLPELVYEGLHVGFFAHRITENVNPKLTPYMRRDEQLVDLCKECLLNVLTKGKELTKEDIENMAVTP